METINNNLFLVRRIEMKLNKEEFARYQSYWKKSQFLTEEEKRGLIAVSDLFLKRVEEKGDEVEDVILLFPEDFTNLEVLREFAGAMDAKVVVRPEGGAKVEGWFLNYRVQVE